MSRTYCTYFDHRYLSRGLAMIRSLRRVSPDAVVWVLCLSGESHEALKSMAEPGVELLTVAELENGDGALARAKADGRSIIEYYFTLTPSLLRHVMEKSRGELVTYLDADLYFYSSIDPVYEEMGGSSVLIIPHNFTPAMRHKEIFGRYNVGWMTFRADDNGRSCLQWWRDRTNEWCRDTVDEDNGRFCEQRYLDYFADRFAGVHVLAHPGANLAPWNIGNRLLSWTGKSVSVDSCPLIFFHVHGIKQLGKRHFFTVHRSYAAPMTDLMREHIYRPYFYELIAIERQLAQQLPSAAEVLRHAALPDGIEFPSWLKSRLSLVRDWLQGYIIKI